MRKHTIEFAGEAVAALVPASDQFRFIAVKYSVWPLDGKTFAKPEDAVRAIAMLHGHRHRQPIVNAGARPIGARVPANSAVVLGTSELARHPRA
ncbi:hypothetical protein [Sinorhizobium alkalisoli]|uniref:Uncharacterized protein n=1 Tax=Sinorhizobium alkalisoli TaxID=1752398 RepID=A0A1E3V8F7_9HYPH|nr:hypothetical protein [Sinorhizobium alkalisoli]ODR89717.1 hypothetical protein A8M32_16090 [Sinorhizobium alkalisoli]QFI65210.1 hypothetical protein EKH55_0336 [Sinorhizobium alkalisoli]